MADIEYHPIAHDHDEFLKTARQRQGFNKAYEELAEEYSLVRELITARSKAGMTQEEVAQSMGTTKSAVSRLEAAGKHSPSVATLKKYAKAVGCEIEIRLLPVSHPAKAPNGRSKARR